MLIYRIEHPSNGYGPYSEKQHKASYELMKFIRKMSRSHELSCKHPGPFEDFDLNSMDRILFCGMDSESKILEWFKGYRSKLRFHGFKLSIFEADPIFYNSESGQILFKRLECEPIKIKNIP